MLPAETPSAAPSAPEPAARPPRRTHASAREGHRGEFVFHLAIVTLGVLIALLLEGALQWSQNRSLAREARANIREEIRGNSKRLDDFFALAKESTEQRRHLRQLIESLQGGKPVADATFNLRYSLTQLASAAWETAGATGALGHMAYREVRSYAGVYSVQARFQALEGDLLREFSRTTMHGLDPEKMTPAELATWKNHLAGVEASMRLQTGIAGVLKNQIYPAALAEDPTKL
jgi:hypothetical protein